MSLPIRRQLRTCSDEEIAEINQQEDLSHARAYESFEDTRKRMQEQSGAGDRRLESWVQHPDERVPLALLESDRDKKWWAGWKTGIHFGPDLLKRSFQDANAEGVHWTPLLDALWRAKVHPWTSSKKKMGDLPSLNAQVSKLAPAIEAADPDQLDKVLDFECLYVRGLVAQVGKLTPALLSKLSHTPRVLSVVAEYNSRLGTEELDWLQDWALDALVACNPAQAHKDHRSEITEALRNDLGPGGEGVVSISQLERAAQKTFRKLWGSRHNRRGHSRYHSGFVVSTSGGQLVGGKPPNVNPGERVELTDRRQDKLVEATHEQNPETMGGNPYRRSNQSGHWIFQFFDLPDFTEHLSAQTVSRLFDKLAFDSRALVLVAHPESHEGMWRKAAKITRASQGRWYPRGFFRKTLERPAAIELDSIWNLYLKDAKDGILADLAQKMELSGKRFQQLKETMFQRLKEYGNRDRPTRWGRVSTLVEALLDQFITSGDDLWRIYQYLKDSHGKEKVMKAVFNCEEMDEDTVVRILEDTRSRNIREKAVEVDWIRKSEAVRQMLADTEDRKLLKELIREAQGSEFAHMFSLLVQKEPDEAVKALNLAQPEQLKGMTRDDFLDLLVKGDQQARELAIRIVSRIETDDEPTQDDEPQARSR